MGSSKFKGAYTLDDVYKTYIATYKGRTGGVVNRVEFRRIAYALLRNMMKYVLYKSGTLRMGSFLGTLRVKKMPVRIDGKTPLKYDYNAKNTLGLNNVHLNEHTDGFYYRFFWNKGKINVKNKSAASFSATREHKRELAAILKTPNRLIDYLK